MRYRIQSKPNRHSYSVYNQWFDKELGEDDVMNWEWNNLKNQDEKLGTILKMKHFWVDWPNIISV